MSDNQPPSPISKVFPLVPEDALPGLLLGLTARDSAEALAMHSESATAFDNIADWMLRAPSTSLGSMLPGLWLARDDRISSPYLPVRNVVALNRLGITFWGDVLELTPSHLLDIRGFGEGSLRPILAAAACVSVTACCSGRPPTRCPTVDAFEPRRFTPRRGFRASEFKRLADWAANETGAKTVGDLLAACSAPHLPEDIALLRDALRGARLDEIVGVSPIELIEVLVNDLCGVLDKRTQTIFLARISLNSQRTLDDLSSEIGVTKERVRQLSVRAEERIREALRSSRFAPVNWRAHRLATLLGTAAPPGPPLESALGDVVGGVSDANRERVTDFLLWLGGPYSWQSESRWLCTGDVPDGKIVEACSDERGRVNLDRVRGELAAAGLLTDAQSAWLEQIGRVKLVEGNWLLWTGTVADKAVRLLEVWGEPATPEAIVNAIGEGHSLQSTRNRLFDDPRVMRVDMTRVGLRAWGMEEYSSIAEEIDQELERRGGSADLGELITTLVERFGLRENSIKFYVTAPMFILEGGTLRRRTSADPLPAVTPVTETVGCYLLGPDALSWRIDVNADALRGSGRQMPASIAWWLGVAPGSRRVLTTDGGTVGVTWPETSATGPALGSIRFLAERVGARQGDQVLLFFRRDEGVIDASRVDAEAVDAAQGFERLALLTGIPNGDGEAAFLHSLGVALGVRGTRAAVSAELKQRGEAMLAALIPAESASPELDAAIDALKDLF